jgi:acyl carrier protein
MRVPGAVDRGCRDRQGAHSPERSPAVVNADTPRPRLQLRGGMQVMQDIEQRVRTYIRENFMIGWDGSDLARDDSFLQTGLIDSAGVLELIAFLEATFEIPVADDELTPDNLDSIANIVEYVARKRAA